MSLAKSLGVALVTGASQGIGKAIAIRLASDGFKVALNDLPSKKEQLDAVAQDIDRKYGLGSFVAPADVSHELQVKEMVEASSKALGGLNVMVANAGIPGAYKPIIEMSSQEWDEVQRTNLRSAFLCYKYGAKEIIAGGHPGGRIIGASSYAGKQGTPFVSHYSAAKFGIRGLTQSVALELGQYGITVNAYAPGPVRTPMAGPFLQNDESLLSTIKKIFPNFPSFAKIGEPEDIASIVSYLVSKEAHYITGQTISVNSGLYFD